MTFILRSGENLLFPSDGPIDDDESKNIWEHDKSLFAHLNIAKNGPKSLTRSGKKCRIM